ncbi:hypothetical protein [Changpingibacter yushuensis]|uniref:hypothetical protein n=1 Tax=Changpingibacter yushuensis TaxID=2758440 RepID=UPI0015F72810|nr:hypothetical protein [Changpingibacter yushuensis]
MRSLKTIACLVSILAFAVMWQIDVAIVQGVCTFVGITCASYVSRPQTSARFVRKVSDSSESVFSSEPTSNPQSADMFETWDEPALGPMSQPPAADPWA